MNEPFNWTCPFCNHHQMVTEHNISQGLNRLYLSENKFGTTGLYYTAISCLNDDCQEVYLSIDFDQVQASSSQGRYTSVAHIQQYVLRPEHLAKTFPHFIPAALRQDYLESCRIRDLSPKASATLARRCIQGIIRDFCKVTGKTLYSEIENLKQLVDDGKAPLGVTVESVEAIDHTRSLGNIGAHMEKDINVIIDIDPGEAQSLIDLIELLFQEWYIVREERQLRLSRLKAIREEKSGIVT